MRLLVSDLDRTLVHPARSLPAAQEATVVEIYQGRGITVASQDDARRRSTSWPPPARSCRSRRARRSSCAGSRRSGAGRRGWAICANGATLLHRGQPTRSGRRSSMRPGATARRWREARAAFERDVGSPETRGLDAAAARLRRALPLRHAACSTACPTTCRRRADAALEPLGWQRDPARPQALRAAAPHLQGPRAATTCASGTGADAVMAAGDSLLDVELLLAAEERWCPRDAELVALGRVPAGTRVTSGVHVMAAEQIARSAREWQRQRSAPTCGVRPTADVVMCQDRRL